MAVSRFLSALLIAAALGSFVVAVALAAPETTGTHGWQVLESHGGVRYRSVSERHWWPARTGVEIPDGSSIATGSSGFLIIAGAGESITVHPNSRLELRGGPGGTNVHQAAGNLRYRITRASDRRFGVETPYLSLMVKGTVFEVGVSDHGAEVEVAQGRVRVDTPRGQVAELTPGQSARIAERTGTGLEIRPGPESPFTAAPPPNRSITAAYTRDDGNGGTASRRRDTTDQGAAGSETAHSGGAAVGVTQRQLRVDPPSGQVTGRILGQSAPTVMSAGPHPAFRTVPRGPLEAAPAPSRSTVATRTSGEGTGGTDRQHRDVAIQGIGRSDQASPGGSDGPPASGAGVDVTVDGLGVGGAGPQIAELNPGPLLARRAGVGPDSATGGESAVAAVPPPDRSIVTTDAHHEANDSRDRQRRDASDQAAHRADQASSGGGTGDRVAMAALVLVLLLGFVWWRRQRQVTVGNSDPGRWPWQRPRVGASPGAPSSDPSSTSIRGGTRHSTTHARL